MYHERNIRRSSGVLEILDVSENRLSRTSSISEDSDSDGSHLYETCNAIIANINSALDETGWAKNDKATTVRFREVALSLKHWQNSVRWCASTKDETNNDGVIELQMYELLRREDQSLLKTIRTYMDEVSQNLSDICAFFTNNERGDSTSNESLKTELLEELKTSMYCLSLQLIPLHTFAELNVEPRASILPETLSQTHGIRTSETRDQVKAGARLHATESTAPSPAVPVAFDLVVHPEADLFETEDWHALGTSQRRKIAKRFQVEDTDFASIISAAHTAKPPQAKSLILQDHGLPKIDWLERSRREMMIFEPYEDKNVSLARLERKRAPIGCMNKETLHEEYTYSSISKNQIRLLLIMPGDFDDPLHTSLFTVGDHDIGSERYPYSALSYDWCGGFNQLPIFIQSNPRSIGPLKSIADVAIAAMKTRKRGLKSTVHAVIEITKSRKAILIPLHLYQALQSLRQHDTVVALWVDYLCIDQTNIQEKGEQTAKMPDIFRKAYNVCGWLGIGTRGMKYASSDTFEHFVRKIINANMGMQSWIKEETDGRWKELIDLLSASWFTHRWIIQDVAVAQNVTIHWGSIVIDWSDLRDVIFILSNKENPCTQELTTWSKLDNNRGLADFVFDVCNARLLVEITSDLFRKDHEGKLESRKNLKTLVFLSSRFVCQDPRDTIYALTSLASEFYRGEKNFVIPNYSKSTLETYGEFILWVADQSQSLDILCQRWAIPDFGVKLPSWVGLVNYSAFVKDEEITWDGQPRTYFVRSLGFKVYNAGGADVGRIGRKEPDHELSWEATRPDLSKAEPPDMKPPGQDRPRLEAVNLKSYPRLSLVVGRGVIGSVVDVSSISGFLSSKFFEILGCSHMQRTRSSFTVPAQTWRTLVADRTSDGHPVPPGYGRACLDSLIQHADAKGYVNIGESLKISQGIEKEYVTRVVDVISGRSLIQGIGKLSQREQLVGLGPRETRAGDFITVLYGCSVPVILRKHFPRELDISGPESSEFLNQAYELIGEAYFYGYMEGEALQELEEQSFELV